MPPQADMAVNDAPSSGREFTENIATFRISKPTEEVSAAGWTLKLIRAAVVFPTVYGNNREFQPEIGPGIRLGDTNTKVLAIELLIRNGESQERRVPTLTLISNSGADALMEYGQFTAGPIERRVRSTLVLRGEEQVRGVVAFECCLVLTCIN
jgi:hypothetical protein